MGEESETKSYWYLDFIKQKVSQIKPILIEKLETGIENSLLDLNLKLEPALFII